MRPSIEPSVVPLPSSAAPSMSGIASSPSQGTSSLSGLALSLLGQQLGSSGNGGPGGLSPWESGSGGTAGLARRIGSWIDSRPGFSVGGLEGYNGMGQISTGHIENSQHYTGHAGDVSYNGGGRFPNEMAALDWLYNRLNKRWGDQLTELIWRAPDHWDHLHYGTRPGG